MNLRFRINIFKYLFLSYLRIFVQGSQIYLFFLNQNAFGCLKYTAKI